MTEPLKELQREMGGILFILFICFGTFFIVLGSITANPIGLLLGIVSFVISLVFLLTEILPRKKKEGP